MPALNPVPATAAGILPRECRFISAESAGALLFPARDKQGNCNQWFNFRPCQELHNLLIKKAEIHCDDSGAGNHLVDIVLINFADLNTSKEREAFWNLFFQKKFPLDYNVLPNIPTNLVFKKNTIDIGFFTQVEGDRGRLAVCASALTLEVTAVHQGTLPGSGYSDDITVTQKETFKVIGFNLR